MESDSASIGFVRKKARQLLKDAGISKSPILLNEVIKFVHNRYGVDVTGANLPEEIDGISVEYNGTNNIGYNQNKHPHRIRFTLAHEIAHVILGHVSPTNGRDLQQSKVDEREADEFAAELLMPKDLIKKDLESSINAKLLSEKYWVSEQVFWIRLIKLKLV